MANYQIALGCYGSLRRDSMNRKLAIAVRNWPLAEFSFSLVSIGDLPLYNQDDDETLPSLSRSSDAIKASQGVIFARRI